MSLLLPDRRHTISTGCLTSRDISKRGSSDSPFAIGTGLVLKKSQPRRESFLYRNEVPGEQPRSFGCIAQMQTDSRSAPPTHTEEVYVTPYAQVIASLKRIRGVFMEIIKECTMKGENSCPQPHPAEDDGTCQMKRPTPQLGLPKLLHVLGTEDSTGIAKVATETLCELDWVLETLDQIQAQRPVSSLTNLKFKRLLDISLSNLSVLDKEPLSPIRHRASTGMAPLGLPDRCHEYLDFASQAKANASVLPIGDTFPSRHSSNKTVNQITEYINQFFEPTDELRLAAASANNAAGSEAYELPAELREIEECDTSPDGQPSLIGSPYKEGKTDLNMLDNEFERSSVGETVAIRVTEKPSSGATAEHAFNTPAEGKSKPLTVFQLNEAMRASELSDFDRRNSKVKTAAAAKFDNGGHGDEEFYEGLLKSLGLNGALIRQLTGENINIWDFEIFEFESATPGHTLSILGYSIFKERNLMAKFNIPPQVLVNCLQRIEGFYRPHVIYHNSIHAADVMQSAHYLLSAQCLGEVYSDLEVFSVLFACAVHDVDHPGLTNQFLIRTENTLALLYNDISVLENHHLSVAFGVLQEDSKCDILCGLSKTQRQTFRKMVIDMVLATDMSKHMSLLADLKTTVESKRASGSSIISLDTYSTRILILENLVHAADLNGTAKKLSLYLKWVDRVTAEFYQQGEQERSLGLDVSAMCDRESTCVPTSQVSFIDFITYPLWETWSDLVYPHGQIMMDNIAKNRCWFATVSHKSCLHELKPDDVKIAEVSED
ncbi:cAMP-specific 3',5'-cyclic phosphodiesterase 4D [Sparganum proliferum]